MQPRGSFRKAAYCNEDTWMDQAETIDGKEFSFC